jgi:hypothetical protein
MNTHKGETKMTAKEINKDIQDAKKCGLKVYACMTTGLDKPRVYQITRARTRSKQLQVRPEPFQGVWFCFYPGDAIYAEK